MHTDKYSVTYIATSNSHPTWPF